MNKRNLLNRVKNKTLKERVKESFNNNKFRLVFSSAFIIVLVIVGIILIKFNFSKAEDTSTLLSDQTIGDLTFTNASINNNKLEVIVTNTSSSEYSLKTINVKYLDESGNEITTVIGYIGNTIKSQDSKKLVVDTDVDLGNAKKINYNINK